MALYHDPALYYKDDGKEKTAVELEFIDEENNSKTVKILEGNPNKVKAEAMMRNFTEKFSHKFM